MDHGDRVVGVHQFDAELRDRFAGCGSAAEVVEYVSAEFGDRDRGGPSLFAVQGQVHAEEPGLGEEFDGEPDVAGQAAPPAVQLEGGEVFGPVQR